jgi:hypothetical protein
LDEVLTALRADGLEVLLGGDFNCHRTCASAPKDAWYKQMASTHLLVDVHAELHRSGGQAAETPETRFLSELEKSKAKKVDGVRVKRRLDYFLATKGLMDCGAITAAGVLTDVKMGVTLNCADHKLVVVELEMRVALGLSAEEAEIWEKPDLLKFSRGDKRLVQQYEKEMAARVAQAGELTMQLHEDRELNRNGALSDDELHQKASETVRTVYDWITGAVRALRTKSPHYCSIRRNIKTGGARHWCGIRSYMTSGWPCLLWPDRRRGGGPNERP